MADKRIALSDLPRYVRSGMTVGIGGGPVMITPIAMIRAVLRSGAPDLALIHAIAATADGMLLLDHMEDDALLAQASRAVVASTERIVAPEELRRGDGVILQGIHVTALVEAPGGARPTFVRGVSPVDADAIHEYVAAAVDDATFKRYLDRYVYG